MPRGRGGRRRGTAGKAYPNRSDLRTQAVAAPSGGEYGSRKASEDAQRAIPLPRRPNPVAQPSASYAKPGAIDFGGDSAAPEEPLTAGMAQGPGPGPEALVGRLAPTAGLEAAAFKVDVLRTLAVQPFASPEVKLLLKQAVDEMSQFTSPPVAAPPAGPVPPEQAPEPAPADVVPSDVPPPAPEAAPEQPAPEAPAPELVPQ